MDEDIEKGKDESESTDTSVKVKDEPKERHDIKVGLTVLHSLVLFRVVDADDVFVQQVYPDWMQAD